MGSQTVRFLRRLSQPCPWPPRPRRTVCQEGRDWRGRGRRLSAAAHVSRLSSQFAVVDAQQLELFMLLRALCRCAAGISYQRSSLILTGQLS